MELDLQLHKFETSDALDTYIEKRMRSMAHRLDERFDISHVTLRGEVLARKPDGKSKNFLAELLVKVPWSKTPYVVKKTHANFRNALSEAVKAMEAQLRRDSEKRSHGRRATGQALAKTLRKLKKD